MTDLVHRAMKDIDKDAPVTGRTVSLKFTVTLRQMHKAFDQRVANIGVTRSQWTLIAVIKRHPGATQREIAEVLEMSEASAGRLVDRLCAEGYLERRPKEDDRRAYCVHLTGTAEQVLDKISSVAAENEKQVFAGFSQAEMEQLDSYLDRLAANAASARA
jgi:MarR family transcriptional regulator for hemolysin